MIPFSKYEIKSFLNGYLKPMTKPQTYYFLSLKRFSFT